MSVHLEELLSFGEPAMSCMHEKKTWSRKLVPAGRVQTDHNDDKHKLYIVRKTVTKTTIKTHRARSANRSYITLVNISESSPRQQLFSQGQLTADIGATTANQAVNVTEKLLIVAPESRISPP